MQRSVIKKIEKQVHIYVFKEELTQDELNDLMVFETIINDYQKRHCELICKPSTQALYDNYIKVHLSEFKKKIAKDVKKRDIENLILAL